MGVNKGGQIKVLQLDAMQPPKVWQFRVRAVFPDKLEGQTAAIFGGMDGTGVRPLFWNRSSSVPSHSHSSSSPVISSISFLMLVPRRSSVL